MKDITSVVVIGQHLFKFIMSFGDVLREIRKKRGSLRQVADILEIDFAYLSKLENNRVTFKPSRDFLNKIVEKLNCDEAEKNALFSEAGRIEEEIEQAAQEVNIRPNLKTLFRAAPKLSDEDIDELNQRIQQILQAKNK
ncbi:MAG: helix-turn-helix domain-containing protein [Acidobacteriota bacterium]|nr:helix-turn-helix domain-containing protein [Acidobacteriota bacterium]